MVYRVYSDAAVQLQEGYSSIAFLVLEGNKFVKSGYEVVRGINSSSTAESLAMGLALRYIVDELDLTEEDSVIIFCDSLYVFKFAMKCLKMRKSGGKGTVLCSKPTSAYWLTDIYDYIPRVKAELKFSKVTSHQGDKNPHCYVDRLAKVGLVLNK